jgi:putative heme-binding domain-containing protein
MMNRMRIIQAFLLTLCAGVLFGQAPGGNALSSGLTGDAVRGQAVYEGKGNCSSCHRIKGVGARTGPDLTEVGARRPPQLEAKLLTPDVEINAANRPFRVTLKNGTVVNGRLLNEDTFTVQLLDDKENLRSFIKADLRDFVFVEKSPMPSFKGKLSTQEIADVVAYLGTLRPPASTGGGRGGAGGGAPTAGAARGPAIPPADPAHIN